MSRAVEDVDGRAGKTDWRKVDHEKAQRAPGAQWPSQNTLAPWRAHGGEWHGPHVETVTMPMYLLSAFLDAYADRALSERVRVLEAALRPFVDFGSDYPPDFNDIAHVAYWRGRILRVGEFRAAARALAPGAQP